MIKTAFITFLICWTHRSYSAQIVFFKSFNSNGEPIIFEGPYSHSAIKYKGLWLHAQPYYGVRLSSDLKSFGPNFILLENPNYPEPSEEFVSQALKMKFNIFAPWYSQTETYCSKLTGQALNVPPSKMYFQSNDWKKVKGKKPIGQLGLSPNDVYWYARRNLGFKKVKPEEVSKNEFTMPIRENQCSWYLN